ncbi:hypothetical protein FAZ19_20495 [Sphingobacterium alkalisoli]|uniref:Uncharacterized protein n=1 Tax=Sphingobacterium alkalisoli TaxID=1874115 RepID=A0A4U0GTY7_9SPHI|nr:hypothetical protein [Sphingobacterium alkalisoli]TJY62443.1 hypothetical protein FAZ19_20495 [Sphingobacterium alkalisoli]GGH29468.1 hypothetical protein GCM10011418_40780 [Sphingobacterium alkalisoli]
MTSKYNIKINYIRILTLFILIINSQIAFSQLFDGSQSHFRVKWKQINTDKFQLIFPGEFSSTAPALANRLELFIEQTASTLNRPSKKISIILQQNHISQNGFVQLAPRKSEFYSTPSSIADNQEWLPNLALHESRHFAQFDNLTGNLKKPFFEQLALALFGLNLPAWFFEGDAVLQETLFSNGGRGRLTSWNMPIRANIQSDLLFDFNKYVHGSFKDIVPSYYSIGYFMNSILYEKDPEIHGKILEEMNGNLLRPFNFERSLKKYSAQKSSQLFKSTIHDLTEKWNKATDINSPSSFEIADRFPTDYFLPQMVNNTVYALQHSRQLTPKIVRFENKNTKRLYKKVVQIGQQLMPYFHVQGHLIVWDEYRKDPRFEKQTYNIINVYDVNTGKTRHLTHNTRYYSPVLSTDLNEIAVIEVSLANRAQVVFLDSKNGAKLDSITMPTGTHIQQPQFHATGTKLIAIAVNEKGTNLIEINRSKKEIQYLLDWSNFQLERPIYIGEHIVFKANFNEKDDIYLLENGDISQLTDSQFGAFNPFASNDTLYYNTYTTNGYKVNIQPLIKNNEKRTTPPMVQTLYPRQNNTSYEPLLPAKDYPIQNYNVTKNSFNFHSITLSGNDFESFDNLKPGIFWISNDILNTTAAKLGYEYDTEIQKSTYSAELSYQRYFPKVSLSYKNRGQLGQATRNGNRDSIINFDYREHYLAADIQLPFSIYRGNKVYSYGINMGTSYQKRYNLSLSTLTNFNDVISFPLNYQLYFNKNSLRATMDILPRWGQNFSFTYRHLPFENELRGDIWSLRTNFYFPGILLNHSLQLRYSMQESAGRYLYSNDIPLVNGFANFLSPAVKNTLLFDYRLPIVYPDWSIGNMAYLKRIRGIISADYQNLSESDLSPKTAGAGLSFDFNAFKYPLPLFTFSSRLTYINDKTATARIVPTFSFGYSY